MRIGTRAIGKTTEPVAQTHRPSQKTPAIAASGFREVLVVPVQFLADHLEVLYDLDVAAADEARAAGLRYRRTRMPNTQAAFVHALATVARAAPSESAHGRLGSRSLPC